MRLSYAACLALLCACSSTRPPLPPPLEPLVPTPDADFRSARPKVSLETASANVPEVESVVLENGLSIWVVSRPRLPLVTLSFVTRHSGPLESEDPAELIELTNRTIVEGGTTWVDGSVVEPVRVNGQAITTTVHPSHATLGLTVSTRALAWSVKALAQTILAPAWPGNLNAVRLSELVSLETRSTWSTLLLKATVGAAYGDAIGALFPPLDAARVTDVPVTELRACYERTFKPETSALIAVGDTRLSVVRELAERAFGSWRGTPRTVTPSPPKLLSKGRKVHFFPQPERDQAHLSVLQPAPTTLNPEDELPFSLLAELAFGGIRSRAHDRLRHDLGLTYGICPRLIRSRRLGLLAIETSVETGEAAAALRELLSTLETLQQRPVSEEELNRAKLSYLGRFNRQLGDDRELAELLARGFAEERPAHFLTTVSEQLHGVRSDAVHLVAQRYLKPGDAEIGVAGDFSLERPLRSIGEVSRYAVTKQDP